MKVFNIRLSTIEQVRNFVNTVSKYDCDVDLKSGRYLVDAKSIMGIFSLDLMNKIEVTIHDDCYECCEKLLEEIKDLIVD